MASRLLAGGRSRNLAQALKQTLGQPILLRPWISAFSSTAGPDSRSKPFAADFRSKTCGDNQSSTLSSLKPFYDPSQIIPRWFSSKSTTDSHSQANNVEEVKESKKVMAFSPLEATLPRKGTLGNESSKVKRYERSINITYYMIPALLLVSKWNFTTALAVVAIYHQLYGFFKEIILDYVHHEVTQKWVFIYLSLLLIYLAKETIVLFNLV